MSLSKQNSMQEKAIKNSKSNEIHPLVVKHFQPSPLQNNTSDYFPEVDCDVDLKENLPKPNFQRLKAHPAPDLLTDKFKTTPNAELNSTRKLELNNRKPMKPRSLSRSNVPEKNTNKKFSKRSRSFPSSSRNENIKERPKPIKPQNKFESTTDCSSVDEKNYAHLQNLKAEIQQNRFNSNSNIDKNKFAFMYEDGKIRSIRDEIITTKNEHLANKRKIITEIKTEIAEYKKTGHVPVQIYNVTPGYTKDQNKVCCRVDKSGSSTTEPDDESSSENCDAPKTVKNKPG